MSRSQNKINAWKFFYPEGNGYAKKGYHLHHVDETLRHENLERYEEWNPEDLVMITSSEHLKLHRTGKKWSDEMKKKMSESHKNGMTDEVRKHLSEGHKGLKAWNKGKHNIYSEETLKKFRNRRASEETKQKLRESHLGQKAWNKGISPTIEQRQKISETLRGNKWWNNGTVQVYSKVCPEGFVRGMLRKRNS